MLFIHHILITILSITLFGCQEANYTHDYLIQHPLLLKDEIEYCQSLMNKTPAQTKRCDLATTATATLMVLISERQQDPERFGQRVIDAEISYVKAKQDHQAARQVLDILVAKKATNNELEIAKTKVIETKQLYQAKRNEIKALLAVIGMSSPE